MLKEIIYWINLIFVLTAIISVLKSRKSPASVMAWILAVLTLPGIGLIIYVLFGIDWRKRRLVSLIPEELFSDYLEPILSERDFCCAETSDNLRSIQLLTRAARAPVTEYNSVQTFYAGKQAFESLMNDIESARESVHMEYYLWCSDSLGKDIGRLLERKAREGVKVRLIFDGWGSFGKISYAYRKSLKDAGVEFSYFLDLANPLARLKINYRNHRKIAVIDGKTAYTGGMNISEIYISGGRRFDSWRDTHLRLKGPAVSMLQAVFLADWHNSGRELLLDQSMFPAPENKHPGIPVQIAISGPDSPWAGLRLHYLELINGAEEEVLIQTPYYIPGEAVEQALIAAALRGVRVKLMTIAKPDKYFPFWAAQTYFAPLLEAGVGIYRYSAGFIHSKVFIQDRRVVSAGTCNVDLRSFYLDYEVNAVLYSESEAALHARQFFRDLEDCVPVTSEDMNNIPQLIRIRNAVFRMFSPLM